MAEVELPQLGESVTEGIITQWLVEVGDEVEQDQPLVEISTDKVDTELPSPVAGVVQELRAEVDDTVQVGDVLAVVGEGEADTDGEGDPDEGETDEEGDEAPDGQPEPPAEEEPTDDEEEPPSEEEETTPAAGEPPEAPATGAVTGEKALTSPLVRKMLREAGLSPSDVRGSGQGGRITREDAERAIAAGGEREPAAEAPARADAGVTPPPAPAARPSAARQRPEASPTQIDFDGGRQVTEDISRVRRAIANAMHESLQTTAQLTAAVEVDVTAIMNLRAATKEAFKRQHGVSLSPLPFFARAACMTIPRHPAVNASIDMDDETATFHNFINLGMAVDTERGLLVPNIKNAEDLTIPGLARQIADIASRTREKKLAPDDIQGGTFTITNTGSRGTLWDTPILNPPEVAILATCAIEKRPVVVSDNYGDSIAVRWMTYLCMTYDHRMLDGADTARFLQDLKWVLETHDFRGELGV